MLARYDCLTGLANRYLFADGLAAAIARAARERKPLGVLLLDLDRFKEVNDTLGHSAGDELLKRVAARLKKCLRRGDLIARLGGDEFAVLLERADCASLFAKVAQKLVDAVSSPFEINGQEVFVTTSIGVATCPDSGINSEALMKAANRAREVRMAAPIAKPLPMAAVVLPAESRMSVRRRTSDSRPTISAIPPALSATGP